MNQIVRKGPAAIVLLALLVLGACSVTPVREGLTPEQQAALTPAQQLFVVEADYLINKADFLAYARQPLCVAPNVVGCHDAAVVVEVRAIDKKVQEAFRVARAALGTGSAETKANIARTLLATFAARVALLAIR